MIGKRDIEATLLPGERDNSSTEADNFQNVLSDRGSTTDEQRNINFLTHRFVNFHSTGYGSVFI